MRTQLLSLSLLAALILSGCPAHAEYGHKNDYYEKQRERLNELVPPTYPWAITLNVAKLKKFLEYKGSKLFPVAEVDATLALRDQHTMEFEKVKLYETLWFHKTDGIGLSREMQLALPRDSQGALVIEDTTDDQDETKALCNAITRILLDVHLLDCGFTVIAPDAICQQLSEDLGIFRFHTVTVISAGQSGILLHLVSASKKTDRYFFFEN